MVIQDVVPGEGALVLTGAALLDRRAEQCGEADSGALARDLNRLVGRLLRPRLIGVERAGIEVGADLRAVSALVGYPPDADTCIDPRWDLADTHPLRLEVDDVATNRRDLRRSVRSHQIRKERGER